MSTTVTYKGSTLTTVENATKKLTTAGTWLEDDIIIQDTPSGGGSVVVVDTPDSNGGTIREITAANVVNLESQKQVTMTQNPQTFNKSTGYDGFESIVVTDPNMREDLTIPKDVDFIDYDGRLVYSYTAQEFLALTQMPDNPINAGLVAQGWNWTLVDAKEYVAEWGALVIGQNYTTSDGKTRIYMHLDVVATRSASATPTLYMAGGASGATCVVDWGDGSTQTVTLTANTNKATTHTYNPYYGDFIVTIEVTSGTLRLGYQGANNTIWATSWLYRLGVQKIEIGNGVYGYGRNAFHEFWNCKSISVPTTCNDMDKAVDNGIFGRCPQLRGFVFPSGEVGKVGTSFANVSFTSTGATGLHYISLPKTMTKFAMWAYPRQLRKFTMYFLDNDVNRIDLVDASLLTHYIVPGNYTSIADEPCRSSCITKLTIPGTVTSISNTAFRYNSLLSEVHLKPTTPPTLGNVNAFGGASANLIFYVPYSADHSILEAYQTATNWSTYASQMQEEPQQ